MDFGAPMNWQPPSTRTTLHLCNNKSRDRVESSFVRVIALGARLVTNRVPKAVGGGRDEGGAMLRVRKTRENEQGTVETLDEPRAASFTTDYLCNTKSQSAIAAPIAAVIATTSTAVALVGVRTYERVPLSPAVPL